jgi:hypothetical protein
MNFPWRVKIRQEEALERFEARSKRSTEKQIALIKTRKGNSKKELKRLQELISTK